MNQTTGFESRGEDNMLEVQGKYNQAKIFTDVVDQDSIAQVIELCNQEFTSGSRIRLMPDIHAGAGCTIGTTMTITDKVVPNLVGVDIGCGMYTVKLQESELDLPALDEAAHFVPSGMNVWEGRKERFDLQRLHCYRALRDTKRLERSLGTLGGGNHFIEVERAADQSCYLVIHTGSRNLGKQVAEYYQKLAIDLHKGKEEYFAKKDALIAEYKAAGRRTEIEKALKELHWANHELLIPEELCYLYGTYFEDYLADVEICQQFARRNRELIAEILLVRGGLTAAESFHTIHNYIDVEEKILRKGAISAKKGEKVLIPINMRDGSILAEGLGNPDWNNSAPHGAGRVMSRTKARETLDLQAYRESMSQVYSTSVSESTLDEAPQAYKSLEDIIGVIGESVRILDVMKPIYNFKASD
jgi:RNA-splicing ligase RtcB